MEEAGKRRLWPKVIEACSRGLEECAIVLEEFMSTMCRDRSLCEEPPTRRRSLERYAWIEEIIKNGVPDGRSRLILYVVSRYLLNVKGLDVEEAHAVIKEFIRVSCERHGNCSKIYDSWIRNVLRHVKEGGWRPWSLERVRKEDPELYKIISEVLGLRS
ncbi:MAG: DNA primase noncatalytic subunit PriX [Desulfurococcales archaeon]|nr:DNA primase noncatalytic subunit PriX [Desulfurococcales archaeon]